MSAYVIDSELFRDQFSTVEMRDIFSDRRTVQAWLDVEVALAEAEAELGIIPTKAAEAIKDVGDAALYDLADMKREMDRTSHPIVPLVRAIGAKCEGDYGEYVHWGATTQDITDTGTMLQIRDAEAVITLRLEALSDALLDHVVTHAATAMPGRTHGQHAQPVTFGYKAAIWLDEVRRHQTRMDEMRPRLLVGQFGGAVGTLAALGDQGLAVRERLMEKLELGEPLITWHTARDRLTELISNLAMIAGTCGKIAHEIYVLQKTEVQEVEEPFPDGKVGSSTMPHKRNPAICEGIMALSRTVRSSLPLAFETLIAEHERDKVGLQTEREFISRTIAQTDAALAKTVMVTEGLDVRAENMRENLDITKGLTLSEAVMMALGDKLGRQQAHEILYRSCMLAFKEDTTMRDALMHSMEVREILSEDEIDALLDPEAYTGLAARMARQVADE
ncbi:adenylosuccinate lyase [Rhodospirillales bacterium]|nr:adenylosuccinate lyase [Rhodospirillales bacterium]